MNAVFIVTLRTLQSGPQINLTGTTALAQICHGVSNQFRQSGCSDIFHNSLELVGSGRVLAADLNHVKGPGKVVEGIKSRVIGVPTNLGTPTDVSAKYFSQKTANLFARCSRAIL